MQFNKKFIFITSLFLLLPNFFFAQGICEEIVPCTIKECTLCHFFLMLQRLVNCILFGLIPPLAVLMIVIGGLFYAGAVLEFLPGGIATVSRAKRLFISVVIGLLITYAAWLIITLFLVAMGYTSPTGRWWEIECEVAYSNVFSIPTDPKNLTTFALRKIFEEDTLIDLEPIISLARGNVVQAKDTNSIFALAVSGKITLNSPSSFARIILVDEKGEEFLVYEAFGPFDFQENIFTKNCMESCILDNVSAKNLKVEVENGKVELTEISVLKDKERFYPEILKAGLENSAKNFLKLQKSQIINKINSYNFSHNLKWTAGETSISNYTLAQKKALLGVDRLPNLQGLEYYKGGIFEFKEDQNLNAQVPKNFPSSFDWRKQHGRNWLTPVKDQRDCGSCWAFASLGAIEAVANLYYNQLLNLDLAEQDPVSCYKGPGARGCQGLAIEYVQYYYNYLRSSGVTYEQCFPYTAREVPCSQKCYQWPNLNVSISGAIPVRTNEEIIKNLIEKGPIQAGVFIHSSRGVFGHAVTLVGYETDSNGNLVWIFKNSWGANWGENGYFRVKDSGKEKTGWFAILSPIIIKDRPDLKIVCEDRDNDKYCYWGISEKKPNTCPEFCKEEKDCDDSNASIGPCSALPSPTPTPTPTPTPKPTQTPTPTQPPTPPCINECLPGERKCCGNRSYRECIKIGQCWTWSGCRMCGANEVCQDGLCIPKPECETDADCPKGKVYCTPPPDEYTCGELIIQYYECVSGKCILREERESCNRACCPQKCLQEGGCIC